MLPELSGNTQNNGGQVQQGQQSSQAMMMALAGGFQKEASCAKGSAGIDPSLVVKGNRIKVDRYSQVQGIPGVYAIGDVAYMETPLYPHGHPQLANVAISQGSNLAKNFMRELKGKTKEPYEYHDKGSLATVGRHLAVADLTAPRIHLAGSIAWFVWMSLHLFLILGVKNKLQVFINWIYKYFTYDQSLRLLFKVFNRPRT